MYKDSLKRDFYHLENMICSDILAEKLSENFREWSLYFRQKLLAEHDEELPSKNFPGKLQKYPFRNNMELSYPGCESFR